MPCPTPCPNGCCAKLQKRRDRRNKQERARRKRQRAERALVPALPAWSRTAPSGLPEADPT